MLKSKIGRRGFGLAVVSGISAALVGSKLPEAATPDGVGAVKDMIGALQSARALSFTADASFGASVAKDQLKTLGNRVSVVFQRPDSLFAVFGGGGEDDVQLLIAGGEATLFKLSLGSKSTLKLSLENGAAFSVPGFFIPFLGLLADDPQQAFFGGINSVTAIAQGLPDQPEQTSLDAVMGPLFSGEVWVDKTSGLPGRVNGTWFGARGDVAASAAVTFSGWSPSPPVDGAFVPKGLSEAKEVVLDALGL